MGQGIIFGGHGFVGHKLTKILEDQGNKVIAPTRRDCDIREIESVSGFMAGRNPDFVINAAGISRVDDGSVEQLYQVNAFGHLNLLKTMAAIGYPGRIVLLSSANVYGQNPGDPYLNEAAAVEPSNHYAASKALAEHFNSIYRSKLDLCNLRLFNCIGEGQAVDFLLPKIVGHFRDGAKCIKLGNVEVERDFVDIRDAVAAIARLAVMKTPPPVMNICSGSSTSIRQICATFGDKFGYQIEIEVDPDLVRENDLMRQCGDTTEMRRFGFQHRYSIDDTIAWIYQCTVDE